MEYTLKLTDVELQTIANAIYEIPKRIADPLLAKIQSQVTPQVPKPDTTEPKMAVNSPDDVTG